MADDGSGRAAGGTSGAAGRPGVAFACCFVAGLLNMLMTLLFNGPLFDAHAGILDWSRDLSTAVDAALFLVLLVVARTRPGLIRPLALTVACVALSLVADALTSTGVASSSAVAIGLGVLLSGPVDVWGLTLWLLACSTLGARRTCMCLAASGIAAVPLAACANAWLPYEGLAALASLCSVVVPCLCLPHTRDFFSRLATVGVPAEQEVAHPQAFLPLGHAFYVVIFAFSVAYGFGLRCEPMGSLATSGMTFATLVVVSLYAWHAKGEPRVDTLFITSFAAVAVGFMLALVGDARVDMVSAALLVAGYMCCEMLVWYALCRAAARNVVDAMPVICWGTAVGYVGICVGVALWMAPNLFFAEALGADAGFVQGLVVTAVLAALTMYVLLTRRTFSFDDTIAGIAPDVPPPQGPEVRYVDRLDELCSEAAERVGLTAREAQVMRLLAHGNNASRVQEELGIGRNTVKYHAKNVYAKLGVHSQQELIDAVAGG